MSTHDETPEDGGHGMDKEQFTAWMLEFGSGVNEYVDRQAFLMTLCATFIEDMAWLQQATKTLGATQNARRVFVKTSYANSEGFLWVMKQMALITDRASFTPPLTDDEIAFLSDKELRTDKNTGVVTEVQAKIRLKDNIKETRKILCRVKGCETFNIDLGTGSADKFFVGVGVRDRLTHPKRPEEMSVSDDEMLAVGEGVQWLTNSLGNFIALYRSARKASLDRWFLMVVREARRLGVDEGAIDTFSKRVRPGYKPPTTEDQNSS